MTEKQRWKEAEELWNYESRFSGISSGEQIQGETEHDVSGWRELMSRMPRDCMMMK
jgi:hypothetical protein